MERMLLLGDALEDVRLSERQEQVSTAFRNDKVSLRRFEFADVVTN